MAIGAKYLSERGDLGVKVVLLDDPVGPDPAHQIILAEDSAASVDEGHERVERPSAELDRPAIGEQLAAMTDHLKSAEFNRCCRIGHPSHGGRIVHGCFRTF